MPTANPRDTTTPRVIDETIKSSASLLEFFIQIIRLVDVARDLAG